MRPVFQWLCQIYFCFLRFLYKCWRNFGWPRWFVVSEHFLFLDVIKMYLNCFLDIEGFPDDAPWKSLPYVPVSFQEFLSCFTSKHLLNLIYDIIWNYSFSLAVLLQTNHHMVILCKEVHNVNVYIFKLFFFIDSDVEVFGPSSDSENEFSDEKVERLVAGGSVQFYYPGTGEKYWNLMVVLQIISYFNV